MLVIILLYIEGGIDKSVNCYVCWWDVGGAVVSIDVEVQIDWPGDARNGGYTIIDAFDWFFMILKQSTILLKFKN